MQEMGLVRTAQELNASPSIPKSPAGVLDVSCFSFKTDDSQTAGSSQEYNNNNNNNQAYTPANKRTRLDA